MLIELKFWISIVHPEFKSLIYKNYKHKISAAKQTLISF